MSKRVVLWIAFVAVHAVVGWLGFVEPTDPMGDVHRVYEPWAWCTWHGGLSGFCPTGREIMGITEPWVYPQWALVPMLLVGLAPGSYVVGWLILVTVVDAAAFAVLVGTARSRGRVGAAWFWLACTALMGPVGLSRLDGLTVPLVLLGSLWLLGRPRLAAVLLAIATWIKVWPAAVLAAAVVAVRRRIAILVSAAILSAATLAVVVAGGGAAHAFGFIADQTGRGLQVEAPVAMPYLWQSVLGVPGAEVAYSQELLTFEVTGAGSGTVVAWMTPLLAVAMLAIVTVGVVQVRRGVSFAALFPPLSLALVTAFIVVNKVGSPQYASWIVAPLAVALVLDRRRWWGPAAVGLAIACLTHLVYPLLYLRVLSSEPVPVLVLTVRNALYVVLLVWAVARLVRLPARTRTRAGAPASSLSP